MCRTLEALEATLSQLFDFDLEVGSFLRKQQRQETTKTTKIDGVMTATAMLWLSLIDEKQMLEQYIDPNFIPNCHQIIADWALSDYIYAS